MFPVILAAVVLMALIAWSRSRKDRNTDPPFPGIPMIPQERSWPWGHSRIKVDGGDKVNKMVARQQIWCVDHADKETGLSSFYLFARPAVSVLKYEHAQKLLKTTTNKVGSQLGPYFRPFERIAQMAFGKKNLVRLNGKEWRLHRSIVSKALTSEKALQLSQEHIKKVGNTLVASILQRADGSEEGKTVTLETVKVMKMATLDVFGSSAMGHDFGCCRNLEPPRLASAFDFLAEEVFRRFRGMLNPASSQLYIPTKANKQFLSEREVVRGFLREAVKSNIQRLNEAQTGENNPEEEKVIRNNLLSLMIAFKSSDDASEIMQGSKRDSKIKRNGEGTEETMPDAEDIIDSLIVLLFAGYDTTANALSYALHEIARNPEVEARCVEEARRIIGDRSLGTNAGEHFDVVESLPYCNAVLTEALRLYPPAVAIFRTLEKPMTFDGVTVPAGISVRVPIYHIHRDPRNFHDPLSFLPERWVHQVEDGKWEQRSASKQEEVDANLPPPGCRDAFFSFSSGARNCVGKRFAVQEGTLLLAILVRSLKFELLPGYKLNPQNNGPIMEADDLLPMIMSRRD